MDGALVITSMSWASGAPELRIRQPPTASSILVPAVGFSINYAAGPDSTRHCVGHRPFRDSTIQWFDCNNSPLHEGVKCDRCAASDATFASQLHHAHNKARGELDTAVLAHLDRPNDLYLAAFRDGSVKVGTSTTPRLHQRLDEQGAWAARIVATTPNGMAVRVVEDRISAELGLPQQVSVRRKIDGLVRPKRDEQLDTELDLWAMRVHEVISELDDDRITATTESWLTRQHDDPTWEHVHPYPLRLSSGSHDVEIAAMSGRVAAVRRPGSDDVFAVDLRSVFGLELALGDHAPDELAVQDSLF